MNLFENAMTIEEAITQSNLIPSLPFNENPLFSLGKQEDAKRGIMPTKVFDNVYWVGNTFVGGIIIDTADGYIFIDQCCNEEEATYMKESMESLGLDPSKIKIMMISHEHFDHYGGTQYFLDHVCPEAKVAISRVGWNLLQTIPTEFAFTDPRPKKADILLTDGMCIQLGNTKVFIVATPGHSAGCVSFIYNATYQGKEINVAMMGGTAVWPNFPEARTYQSSIEYFKLFTDIAHCTAYSAVHCSEPLMQSIHDSWEGKCVHPWISKEETFDQDFFQPFRDRVLSVIKNPKTYHYVMPTYKEYYSPIPELMNQDEK